MSRILEVVYNDPDFKLVKETIFNFGSPFNKTHKIEEFAISHTHWVIWQVCKSIEAGKYGEIGSHCGRSAICAAASNPNLEICCFDEPNAGWGGEAETRKELERALKEFAPNRHVVEFGDSQTKSVQEKIKNVGPYDIAFVDGNHSDDGCLQDMTTMYASLKDGGILIVDDLIHHPSLTDVWHKFVNCFKPKDFLEIRSINEEEKSLNFVLRGIGIFIK